MPTRRTLLGSMTGMAMYPLIPFSPAEARSFDAALQQLKTDLPQIFPGDLQFAPNDRAVEQFVDSEFAARQKFFRTLDELPTEQVMDRLDPAAQQLGINNEADIKQTIIEPKQVVRVKGNRLIQPVDNEGIGDVVLIIFAETIGLQAFKGALVELWQQDQELKRLIAQLGDNIQIRDGEAALLNIVDVVAHLFSGYSILKLAELLGRRSEKEVRRRLLVAIGSRLVPFAGWGFTLYCLIACVYAYQDRLANALRR